MLEAKIEQDLKTALLARDALEVSVLRSIKNSLLYSKVAQDKTRAEQLDDVSVIQILTKEAAKRQESADLFTRGNNQERAKAELDEKKIIESYLPEQLGDEELTKLVDEVIAEKGVSDQKSIGLIISAVKDRAAGSANGSDIAKKVMERLSR